MKRTWVFVVSYLVVMALTYVWPWVSNMGLIGAMGTNSSNATGFALGGKLFGSLVLYILITVFCFFRGKAIGKKYLTALPIIGGFFDLVLVFIPFVPTVMHIITLVLGIVNDNKRIEVG